MKEMNLVLGGTGHLGREVVANLVERGEPVRVLSRSVEGARRQLGKEVEVVGGDLSDGSSRSILAGVKGIVVAVSAFHPRAYRRLAVIERDAVVSFLRQAEGAGIRVVYFSVYDLDLELARRLGVDTAQVKADVEDYLRRSRLNWTVLGQPPSMDIFFAMIRGGRRMIVPGGGPTGLPSISARDSGRIAAEALLRDDLSGQRFRLAGPEALSFAEAAERIGEVWGHTVRFRAVPLALPLLVRALLTPFGWFSDRIAYVRGLIAHLRLLNRFPVHLAMETPADHQRLVETFSFTPTTLEEEAKRRLTESIA